MEKKIRDFKCPHCEGHLMIGNNVILLFENEIEKEQKSALVLLNTIPGKYEAKFNSESVPNDGDKLDLLCPICGYTLESKEKEGLSELSVVAEDGATGKLYFAPNMGDHATIVAWDEDEKINFFGKDVEAYSSLFPGFGVHMMNETDYKTLRTTKM